VARSHLRRAAADAAGAISCLHSLTRICLPAGRRHGRRVGRHYHGLAVAKNAAAWQADACQGGRLSLTSFRCRPSVGCAALGFPTLLPHAAALLLQIQEAFSFSRRLPALAALPTTRSFIMRLRVVRLMSNAGRAAASRRRVSAVPAKTPSAVQTPSSAPHLFYGGIARHHYSGRCQPAGAPQAAARCAKSTRTLHCTCADR